MNQRILTLCAVALLVGAAFLVGRGSQWLEAQDRRGPTRPPPNPVTVTEPEPDDVLVYGPDAFSSGTANGMIAVTGQYGVGTSVLYLIDTNQKQMAVYEARGGSRSMRRLVLVAARRIDLDLKLEGLNDDSEFSYEALRRKFDNLTPAMAEVGEPADAKEASGTGR